MVWYTETRRSSLQQRAIVQNKEGGRLCSRKLYRKTKKLSITQTMVTKQLIITVSADELRSYVLLIIHTCLRCLCIIYVVCPSYCIVYNYNLFSHEIRYFFM